MSYILPKLPYAYDALEPHIDARTMEIHHGKHHQAYVDKLNATLKHFPDLQKKSVEELLKEINVVPEEIRQDVINFGGGHANHSLFWKIMAPKSSKEPQGKLAEEISKTFGSFEDFKKQFTDVALGVFGSGWAWLVVSKDGSLKITPTPNQDSPLSFGEKPLLVLDLWEHSYYLLYQNRRGDYAKSWWNLVNWEEVDKQWIK